MITKKLSLFISIVCLASSCIKEFSPKTEKYDELLVVEGVVTDKPGPYTVQLSKSTKIIQFTPIKPYKNCKVEISDNTGTAEVLKEISPGIYKTDSLNGIQGTVGRKYKVSITTPEGEIYESQEQELLKKIEIQSVYGVYKTLKAPEREGYQFFVDYEYENDKQKYILWKLESTYKFKTDFSIRFYYKGGGIEQMIYIDSLKTCYRTSLIDQFFTSPLSLHPTNIPLNYEDNYTKALTIRYSLNVKQYAIGESAYTYWTQIKNIKEKSGSIYSQQPFQVKNNITHITNPSVPALGYFLVAGLSEKRIFVNPVPMKFEFDTCRMGENSKVPLMYLLAKSNPKDWPIFLVDASTTAYYLDKACYDCRKTGVLQKPSFWID